MTTLALVLLLIVVVGLAVATTVGFVRGGLPVATPDVPPPLDAPVGEAADLDRARFGLALRGYRMDQVDEVLDGARDALAARDVEIGRLHRQLLGGDGSGVTAVDDQQPADRALVPGPPLVPAPASTATAVPATDSTPVDDPDPAGAPLRPSAEPGQAGGAGQ